LKFDLVYSFFGRLYIVGGLAMKKIVSCLVVCFMLLTTFSVFIGTTSAEAAKGNQPATFAANRFVKVGFDRDGLPLYPYVSVANQF
jgi:hypothetical protein